ncbi:hypothetical protein PG984_013369 [Apiospora sp. TS-2023a]
MLIQTFAIFAAALGAVAKPLGRPVVTDQHLFAYGKNISGLPIVRVKNGAYLMDKEATPIVAPIQNVTFSCTTENRTLQTVTSGQTEQEAGTANLFGFNTTSGLAMFADLEAADVTTQGFIFFGNMLFVDVEQKMAAKWTVRPVQMEGHSMFEVSWNSTAEDAMPIQLNTRAPMHQ